MDFKEVIKENLTKENLRILEKLVTMGDEEILLEYHVNKTVNDMIVNAIQGKRCLRIYYDHEPGYRLIEPYCYGIHKNTKNFVLRQYQRDGYSESGQRTGWKLFLVDKIDRIEYDKKYITFDVRKEYNPKDKHMLVIIARI